MAVFLSSLQKETTKRGFVPLASLDFRWKSDDDGPLLRRLPHIFLLYIYLFVALKNFYVLTVSLFFVFLPLGTNALHLTHTHIYIHVYMLKIYSCLLSVQSSALVLLYFLVTLPVPW